MNAKTTVILSFLTAACTGALVSFLWLQGGEGDGDTLRSSVDSAAWQRVMDRMDRLEERLEESLPQARTQPGPGAEAFRGLRHDMSREIADLRAEISALKTSRTSGETGALAAVSEKDRAHLDEVLGRYLQDTLDQREKKRRELERRRFEPFLRARMESQLKKTIKKLNLRPDQEERFEESVRQSMDDIMPAFGVVMDPAAPREEKIAAFSRIETAMKTVDEDAQGYMDPDQYESFSAEQAKQQKQMDRFKSMFAPAGNAPGTAPSGGK